MAPAGCGKTQAIVESIRCNNSAKPVLVLTHTNAGVAAIRSRAIAFGLSSDKFRLSTIDGWAMRLAQTFPQRAEIDIEWLELRDPKLDYPNIRKACVRLLEGGHILNILESTYSHILVDEYQDCGSDQHRIILAASKALGVCIVGDPLQSIFGLGEPCVDWDGAVVPNFPKVAELDTPWRWKKVGAGALGDWLLDVRRKLSEGQEVNLRSLPEFVEFVELDGRNDRAKQMLAVRSSLHSSFRNSLVIAKHNSVASQRNVAAGVPGALVVEGVDLRDLVQFADSFDLSSGNVFEELLTFAEGIMVRLDAPTFRNRVRSLERGSARKPRSDLEDLALELKRNPSFELAVAFVELLSRKPEVRIFRPGAYYPLLRALRACAEDSTISLHTAVKNVRERGRFGGRELPRCAVGSTLLLKGLEADCAVVVDVQDLPNARHLYVAITRGAKKLIICGKQALLRYSAT